MVPCLNNPDVVPTDGLLNKYLLVGSLYILLMQTFGLVSLISLYNMAPPLNKQRNGSRPTQSKVLIVEDDNDHWTLISSALSQSIPDVSCVRVSSANEALTLLDSWCTQEWELPKLILQDLYLPLREDGWQLLTAIKSLPMPGNHIPVVVFSSSNHRPDIEGTYQRGAATYIVKPLEVGTWRTHFDELRTYWWDTIALPPLQFGLR